MNIHLRSLLLGSELRLDAAAIASLAAVVLLSALLWRSSHRSLYTATGARIAFGLALFGALVQMLAGELLLFMAGGTVLGFAMLALGLSKPGALAPANAKSIALLLVASDLALLELVMLLAKTAPDVTYSQAETAFAKTSGDALLQFCFVLGFGSRLALPVLCVSAYGRSAASVALLPGWLIVGVCSAVGAGRLACANSVGSCRDAPLLSLLWGIPLLVLLAWQLPRLIPAVQDRFDQLGCRATQAHNNAMRALQRLATAGAAAPRLIAEAEARLTDWPVAMGVLVSTICALALFIGLLAN